MKKLLIFVGALTLGLVITGMFSCSRIGAGIRSGFSGVKGSGNIVTETRSVSDFSKIDVSGVVAVDATIGDKVSVVVEADDNLIGTLKTEVSGDTLKISTADHTNGRSTLKVHITAPDIESIEASGATSVALKGVSNSDLDVKGSGASAITVTGTTQDLDAELDGASKLDARELTADKASVKTSGASNAKVNATDELEADATGASHISYLGKPAKIEQTKNGVSSISAE